MPEDLVITRKVNSFKERLNKLFQRKCCCEIQVTVFVDGSSVVQFMVNLETICLLQTINDGDDMTMDRIRWTESSHQTC